MFTILLKCNVKNFGILRGVNDITWNRFGCGQVTIC